MNTHLLVIDPQNDFCDLPADWWPAAVGTQGRVSPALPVPGAHADMLRLSALVRGLAKRLGDITLTLDTHHRVDVAHPGFWVEGVALKSGEQVSLHPAPFTTISAQDVRSGRYAPRDASMLPRVMAYLDALEAQGRYQLMVWPVHCQMGSWGHGIHAQLQEALNDWSDSSARNVQVVSKGENPWTEHYSALQAEVPDSQDPGTLLNHGLLERLRQSDRILVAGEAGSHCVRATVEHLLTHLQTSEIEKLVLLTDCISPVAGFEAEQKAFFQTCVDAGATLIKSTEVEL